MRASELGHRPDEGATLRAPATSGGCSLCGGRWAVSFSAGRRGGVGCGLTCNSAPRDYSGSLSPGCLCLVCAPAGRLRSPRPAGPFRGRVSSRDLTAGQGVTRLGVWGPGIPPVRSRKEALAGLAWRTRFRRRPGHRARLGDAAPLPAGACGWCGPHEEPSWLSLFPRGLAGELNRVNVLPGHQDSQTSRSPGWGSGPGIAELSVSDPRTGDRAGWGAGVAGLEGGQRDGWRPVWGHGPVPTAGQLACPPARRVPLGPSEPRVARAECAAHSGGLPRPSLCPGVCGWVSSLLFSSLVWPHPHPNPTCYGSSLSRCLPDGLCDLTSCRGL